MKILLFLFVSLISQSFSRLTKDIPRNIEVKIVGGTQVSPPFKYPFMVALAYKGSQFCGGSIIDSTHILTAAHCTFGTPKSNVTAELHRFDLRLTTAQENGQSIPISQMIVHPYYDDQTINNDIAVWVLQDEINSTIASPIQFDTFGNYSSVGTLGRVMGWGTTKAQGNASPTLLQVDIPVVSNTQCAQDYAGQVAITSEMVCLGQTGGGKDSCQGDSGGPMIMNGDSGNPIQVGVVSFGIGCGNPNYPGVYSRVSALAPFIESALQYSGDGCYGVTCENGGTCYDSVSPVNFRCACNPGWIGTYCQTSPGSISTVNIFVYAISVLLALFLIQ